MFDSTNNNASNSTKKKNRPRATENRNLASLYTECKYALLLIHRVILSIYIYFIYI